MLNEDRGKAIFKLQKKDGDFSDVLFYDLSIEGGKMGFCAIYRNILATLYIVDELSLVPYIRIYNSVYNDKSDDNVFDYYFEQEQIIPEVDLCKCANVFKFSSLHKLWLQDELSEKRGPNAGYEVNDAYLNELARLKNKYFHLKKSIEDMFIKDISELLSNKKTVAIHFRGGAFQVGFPNHPVALMPQDYFAYMDNCLNSGYESFFIATDDRDALKVFEDRYPNRIIYYKNTARSSSGVDVFNQKNDRENNGYVLGLEVLRDVYTMSLCEELICGNSQVSFAARVEKLSRGEKFKKVHIIDKGLYKYNLKNLISVKLYYKKIGQ